MKARKERRRQAAILDAELATTTAYWPGRCHRCRMPYSKGDLVAYTTGPIAEDQKATLCKDCLYEFQVVGRAA